MLLVLQTNTLDSRRSARAPTHTISTFFLLSLWETAACLSCRLKHLFTYIRKCLIRSVHRFRGREYFYDWQIVEPLGKHTEAATCCALFIWHFFFKHQQQSFLSANLAFHHVSIVCWRIKLGLILVSLCFLVFHLTDEFSVV